LWEFLFFFPATPSFPPLSNYLDLLGSTCCLHFNNTPPPWRSTPRSQLIYPGITVPLSQTPGFCLFLVIDPFLFYLFFDRSGTWVFPPSSVRLSPHPRTANSGHGVVLMFQGLLPPILFWSFVGLELSASAISEVPTEFPFQKGPTDAFFGSFCALLQKILRFSLRSFSKHPFIIFFLFPPTLSCYHPLNLGSTGNKIFSHHLLFFFFFDAFCVARDPPIFRSPHGHLDTVHHPRNTTTFFVSVFSNFRTRRRPFPCPVRGVFSRLFQ